MGGPPVQSTLTVAPTTGIFCIEEMTATFCNVVTGPNTSGYGSRGVSTSNRGAAPSGVSASSGGAGAISSSIPPCSSEPPFNELLNRAKHVRTFVSAPIPLTRQRHNFEGSDGWVLRRPRPNALADLCRRGYVPELENFLVCAIGALIQVKAKGPDQGNHSTK